jgi:hypothetical protein
VCPLAACTTRGTQTCRWKRSTNTQTGKIDVAALGRHVAKFNLQTQKLALQRALLSRILTWMQCLAGRHYPTLDMVSPMTNDVMDLSAELSGTEQVDINEAMGFPPKYSREMRAIGTAAIARQCSTP